MTMHMKTEHDGEGRAGDWDWGAYGVVKRGGGDGVRVG